MTNPNDPINPIYNEGYLVKEGISKREYFAAKAMQGMLANQHAISEFIAKDAVQFADVLIEELNKTETK